jgi:membrane protein DedA with SNARE-associated domain
VANRFGFSGHLSYTAAGYREKERNMDNTTLIRIVAGVLALVILGIIIWRRKRQSID